MPNPKYRHSKARNRRCRADWRKRMDTATNVQVCQNPDCGQPVLPHHVCAACGFYGGRKVVDVKKKEE